MDKDNTILPRLNELAARSFKNNQFTFTHFLSVAELGEYYNNEKELCYAHPQIFGGCDGAERCIIRFGNPEELGYEEEFPISFIVISPLLDKFSDDLSHRDFLGAIMNLGIERDMLGDIFVKENKAYVICHETMVEYISNSLSKVKHTAVKTIVSNDVAKIVKPTLLRKNIQVSNHRIDAVISKTYNISRNDSLDLFRKGFVYLNGRECTENAKVLITGDVISVRGYGKMIFSEINNINKKGKENCTVDIYM